MYKINDLNLNMEQKSKLLGKIFINYAGRDFRVYKTDDDSVIARIVLKGENTTTVVDYIANISEHGWIIEEWNCLLDNSLIDDIIFDSRELKGYGGEKVFDCSDITFLSDTDFKDELVYRLTMEDFNCVLEDNFSEDDIALVEEYIKENDGDIMRLIHDGMSQTWYQDMYYVVTNIIDNIKERISCRA